jgi:hypothetical protein
MAKVFHGLYAWLRIKGRLVTWIWQKKGESQCLLTNSEKLGNDGASELWAGDKLGSIGSIVRKAVEKLGGTNIYSLM